ncbi:MAG: DUF4382 domain-containing protein [Candidatus Aminicenantia bacterium]
MKKIGALLIIPLFFILFLINCSNSPTSPDEAFLSSTPESVSNQSARLGFLELTLKDKPIDNAQNIFVTINKIRVHKAAPANFIVVSEEEQEFDLLALKNNPTPIVETELEEGHYNQIRMSVVSGRIIIDGVEYEMKVPSKEIKIPVQFEVKEKSTIQIILDFDAEKSIKVIKRGKKDSYILRPVIKVEGISYS